MPNSLSPMSYTDIKEILDKAMEAKRGLLVTFVSPKEAIRWVSRANTYRTIDRKASRKIYEEGHSMHGASAYDVLLIAREEEKVTLLVRSNEGMSVVEL